MLQPHALSAVAVAVLVALSACSDSDLARPSKPERKVGLQFTAAPPSLLAKCRATARAVGYAIPCPLMVPEVFVGTGITGIVVPGSGAWRGWVVGTVSDLRDHVAITASPQPLHNYAKVVNGPAWYPDARVRPISWLTINGWRMRAVYVPRASNDGSAFMNHVVLIWSTGGHTYGIGFHNIAGIQRALRLDQELARNLKLVRP